MLISNLDAGEYYISMAAKSTKANDIGSVFYNVTANLDASIASALEMPETDSSADSLVMADSLSFGQYDTDILAGTYLDSASDKLFGESGSGLLASL